jgi:outer membrane lipoprotein-sorting protein
MNPDDKIKKLIDKSDIMTDAQTEKRILGDALEQLKEKQLVGIRPNIWGIIMRSRMIKLTTAAAIIIAVLAGLPFLIDGGSGVVLADVLTKVEQASAYMYKMTVMGNVITVSISSEYGVKTETDTTDPNTGDRITQRTFFLPKEKIMLTILPEQKKFMQMEYDDAFFDKVKKESNDPREMIKQIMNSRYTELGRSVIEDIEVVGFQTNDPAVVENLAEDVNLVLWVDIDTWLPVRTEIEFTTNEQVTVSLTIDDYQWNIPVVASDFEPVIPDDFTALTDDVVKMPNLNEETVIEGLKLIAEVSGQYPKKLNLMDLLQLFFDLREKGIKENKGLLDSGMTLKEEMANPSTKAEHIKKGMDIFGTFQSLGMFYSTLVQENKEPIYYGELVGPDNPEAVLLRWKISEEKYRVIFGDLSTLDVTAERLAELEKPLIKQ